MQNHATSTPTETSILRKELTRLEAEQERLTVEIALLKRLLDAGHGSGPGTTLSAKLDIESKPATQSKGKITARIEEVVRDTPGIKATQLSEMLADKVESKSPNPKKSIYNTTTNMVSRGKLRRDANGGLHVSQND